MIILVVMYSDLVDGVAGAKMRRALFANIALCLL